MAAILAYFAGTQPRVEILRIHVRRSDEHVQQHGAEEQLGHRRLDVEPGQLEVEEDGQQQADRQQPLHVVQRALAQQGRQADGGHGDAGDQAKAKSDNPRGHMAPPVARTLEHLDGIVKGNMLHLGSRKTASFAMEAPAVTKSYKLEQFEGPLDLLIQMIEQEKLDISELSLTAIAEQFVHHIENNPQQISGHELADFLVVATQLLLLKSRLLVPNLEFDDDLNPQSLETQLKLYRRFVEAARQLQTKLNQKMYLYGRSSQTLAVQAAFRPPEGLKADALRLSMLGVIDRLRPIVILPQSIMEKTVTLHEKMVQISEILKQAKGLSFRRILSEARSKTEKIVSFLALLELVKQQEVVAKQTSALDDIIVEKYSE